MPPGLLSFREDLYSETLLPGETIKRRYDKVSSRYLSAPAGVEENLPKGLYVVFDHL